MQSREFSSVVDTLRQPVLAWEVSYKLAILSAAFFASVRTLQIINYLCPAENILGSLQGLAAQNTARQGNLLGMLGVGSGVLASLLAVGFPPEVLVQFAGLAAIGGLAGQ